MLIHCCTMTNGVAECMDLSGGARASEQACAEIMVWDVDRYLLARSSGRAMVRSKKRVDEDVGRKGRRRLQYCVEKRLSLLEGGLKSVLFDLKVQDFYYYRRTSSGLCYYMCSPTAQTGTSLHHVLLALPTFQERQL